MRKAVARSWKQLAKERIAGTRPSIPLGRKFWPLSRDEKSDITELFSEPGVLAMATSLKSRDDHAKAEVLDAAYWVKGCSSLGQAVFLRELLPQDLKLEIDRLPFEDATHVARYLAYVVGRAHARQMDDASRARWRTDLTLDRSRSLAAPSWLWDSVVQLVADHEAGYLDHCRKYALRSKAL